MRWPRGRGVAAALWPRLRAGPRILVRDLHSGVAVLFAAVFLFFLVSALPCTAFWGGQVLSRLTNALGQESPAGFSMGGASLPQVASALRPLDEIVATARARGVTGTLDIRLAPWPGAPLFITARDGAPVDDRTLLGDAASDQLVGDFRDVELPLIPRLVALGVHVHTGDFGPLNLGLNTAFALSLVWLSITGVVSWWIRRPRRSLGVPSPGRSRMAAFRIGRRCRHVRAAPNIWGIRGRYGDGQQPYTNAMAARLGDRELDTLALESAATLCLSYGCHSPGTARAGESKVNFHSEDGNQPLVWRRERAVVAKPRRIAPLGGSLRHRKN